MGFAFCFQKLTDENAELKKHHDDMKEKVDEMEGGHVLLIAEVDTLKKVNTDQKSEISKLEQDVKYLKETQGGDDNMKDLQDKLIRLAKEQEEKDQLIHSLQGELDQAKEQLKDADSRAVRDGNSNAPKSKTCVIM